MVHLYLMADELSGDRASLLRQELGLCMKTTV